MRGSTGEFLNFMVPPAFIPGYCARRDGARQGPRDLAKSDMVAHCRFSLGRPEPPPSSRTETSLTDRSAARTCRGPQTAFEEIRGDRSAGNGEEHHVSFRPL